MGRRTIENSQIFNTFETYPNNINKKKKIKKLEDLTK